MNRTVISIISLMAFLSAFPQAASIKVGYDYVMNLDGQLRKDDYILLSGQQQSMFFNPTALQMDITSKDDAARQAYGAMAARLMEAGRGDEVPNRAVSMYVFKDFEKQSKTVYDDFSDQFAVYDEPFDQMKWDIIEDSTKTVLGYECVKAVADYHGRDWTVWFAPEIPINDGPWKFAGLPGLILLATDSTGLHSFVANGLESSGAKIPGMPRADWYHKEDRIKYLQARYKYLQDPLADIAGGNLPPNAKVFVNGQQTTRDELRRRFLKILDAGYDFLETDYHDK